MNFDDFIGNQTAVDMFRRAVHSRRVANAYLMTGPPGLGKHTLALTVAAALLCLDPEEKARPCGSCAACSRIIGEEAKKRFHPDLHLLRPDGAYIKVSQMREQLVSRTQVKPHEGAYQVFIIDPAESMHPSAANAFLKTLEEAPGRSVFFLISVNSASLLPTIRSRCQQISFQRVPVGDLAEELQSRLGIDAEEAKLRASLSRGAPGTALSFDIEAFQEERRLMREVMHLCLAEGDVAHIFTCAAALAKEKEAFGRRLDLLLTLLRDVMLLASAGVGVSLIHADMQEELLDLARKKSAARIARLISSIAALREPMIRNVRIDSISEKIMLDGRALFRKRA